MRSKTGSLEHRPYISYRQECNQAESDGQLDVGTSIAFLMVT